MYDTCFPINSVEDDFSTVLRRTRHVKDCLEVINCQVSSNDVIRLVSLDEIFAAWDFKHERV